MIRDSLTTALRAALVEVGITPPESVHLERPARREHGDWSSNVALATAKNQGRVPRELASELVDVLNATPPPHVERVEIAGAGFVNFHLRDSWLHEILTDVVTEGEDGYARPDIGGGRRVNIEFVSANPTGPIHAGGGRWAAFGDALGNILQRCGHEVHREYYLNDRGVQMTLFAESLAARKAGTDLPEEGYQGEYITEWANEMPDDADPGEWGYERVKRELADSLRGIGVEFDTWFSEQSLVESGAVEATLADLRGPRRRLRRGRSRLAAHHRLRRRQGPRPREVGRRARLPAARHRLPPGQVRPRVPAPDRRLGLRPPGPRHAPQGGRAGPGPRPRRARAHPRPARAARPRRRGGPVVEAGRQHRAARRRRRGGRRRTWPG